MKRFNLNVSTTFLVLISIVIFPLNVFAQDDSLYYQGSTLWTGISETEIAGNYAYCAYVNGMVIVDISDSTSPFFVSQVYLPGGGYDIDVSGDYAYMCGGDSCLYTVNISNANSPFIADTYSTSNSISDIFVDNGYVYIAGGNGMQILELSNPSDPQFEGSFNTSARTSDVAVSGDYAYIAIDDSSFCVIDVSDREEPIQIDALDLPSHSIGTEIFIEGAFAYVTMFDFMSYAGMLIIDISNPYSIYQAGAYNSLGLCYDVYVHDNYAYIANYEELVIVDISEPENPEWAGSFPSSGPLLCDVFITGNQAYVAEYFNGLRILDITNPTEPTLEGEYVIPVLTMINDVFSVDDYSYIAAGNSGLHIANISNPSNPFIVGSYNDQNYPAFEVVVINDLAHTVSYDKLVTYDVSDPTNPQITERFTH